MDILEIIYTTTPHNRRNFKTKSLSFFTNVWLCERLMKDTLKINGQSLKYMTSWGYINVNMEMSGSNNSFDFSMLRLVKPFVNFTKEMLLRWFLLCYNCFF